MFIYSKKYNVIVNTEQISAIISGSDGHWNEGVHCCCSDGRVIQIVRCTKDKSPQILKQIFDALKDGQPTFELPED